MPKTLDNGLRACECDLPNQRVTPGREQTCVRCGYKLDPAWMCTQDTTREFLDRLEEATPGAASDPNFQQFRAEVTRRQREGEPIFGQSFLMRDNLTEAQEEAADLCLYPGLHILVERRTGGSEETDIALEIAHHAFQAFSLLNRWKQKELGAP